MLACLGVVPGCLDLEFVNLCSASLRSFEARRVAKTHQVKSTPEVMQLLKDPAVVLRV